MALALCIYTNEYVQYEWMRYLLPASQASLSKISLSDRASSVHLLLHENDTLPTVPDYIDYVVCKLCNCRCKRRTQFSTCIRITANDNFHYACTPSMSAHSSNFASRFMLRCVSEIELIHNYDGGRRIHGNRLLAHRQWKSAPTLMFIRRYRFISIKSDMDDIRIDSMNRRAHRLRDKSACPLIYSQPASQPASQTDSQTDRWVD